MNILDTFYSQIDWDNQKNNDGNSKLFLDDLSKEAKQKYSYAFQIMDDCFVSEPRYTIKDLKDEEWFLKSIKSNKSLNDAAGSSSSFENLRNTPKKLRPGEILAFINYPKVSTFSYIDVKEYKKLSMKLKSNQITPAEFKEFQELDALLKDEQKEYQLFARSQWLKQNYLRHGNILPDVKKYIDEVWQARLHRLNDYPEWYKQMVMVPLVYNTGADDESNEISMVPGRILYKLGKPGRYVFIPRNLSTNLCTNYNDLIRGQPIDNSLKYPAVSRDPIAERILQESEAQVIISSSGLKCLLDNHCTNLTAVWTLPIRVKEYKKGKTTKRVVFIDKKLPPRSMTLSQRVYWHAKIATRILYCRNDNDVSDNNTRKMEHDGNLNQRKNSGSDESSRNLKSHGNEMEIDSFDKNNHKLNYDSDLSEEGLVIDEDFEDTNKSVGQNNVIRKSEDASHSSNFPSTSIRGAMNNTNKLGTINDSSYLSCPDPKNPELCQNITGNDIKSKKCYLYQMWMLGKRNINQLMKSDGETIPIVIRSRLDCIKENYKTRKSKQYKKETRCNIMDIDNFDDSDTTDDIKDIVHLVPKLEYQFDYGAEKITPSECIRQWADVIIRPEAQMFRVRVNPLTGEVIQTERSDHQRMKNDGISKTINLSKTWNSLYSVLSKLIVLAPGNYLLEHSPKHGAFCALSVATERPGAGTSNLYSSYRISVEDVAPIQAPWIPLDETIYTPMCHYNSALPLMYPISKFTRKKQPKKIIGVITKRKGKNKKKKSKRNTPTRKNLQGNTSQGAIKIEEKSNKNKTKKATNAKNVKMETVKNEN